MGDGKVRRVAVVINGDREPRHIRNVERAAELFTSKNYDVYIASPMRKKIDGTNVRWPLSWTVESIADELQGRLDDDDELVIYTTGHGNDEKGGCLVLFDSCVEKDQKAFKRLFSLPHGRRTVIMSQCYGGNWSTLFIEGGRTLFISAGSKDETVCCSDFDPYLFSPDKFVSDINSDGIISWRERYSNALYFQQSAKALFLPGEKYEDMGVGGDRAEAGRFEAKVHIVTTPAEYEEQIKRLGKGDVAVVMYSTHWCEPCKEYRPHFERIAAENAGRALFIRIPNSDEERWNEHGVTGYPKVRLVDGQGRSLDVVDNNDPLFSRWAFSGSQWSDKQYCLEALRRESPHNFSEVINLIDPSFLRDRKFVLELVKIRPFMITIVDQALQIDHEIVLAAVKSHSAAFVIVDHKFRKDREVLLAAVQGSQNPSGKYLERTSYWLQDDQEVVLAAVSNYGRALESASWRLRLHKDIVLAAVRNDGRALEFAGWWLRGNREVVLAAVRNDGRALKFARESLQDDPEIRRIAEANMKP